jgi:hypothetical protein
MPLNSVQIYVSNLLTDLQLPLGSPPLETYITPPAYEDIDRPKAYVWGGRARGKRQTMPRNTSGFLVDGRSGFKHIDWTIDIYLLYETTPDSANVDQEFPTIVDAVMTKLWTTPLNTFITDPTTGVVSEITSIGEEWDFEMMPERTPNTLRMLLFTARISLTVTEILQG